MSWVSVAVAGASAAYKIGSGIHNKNVAKREAKQLEANRPKYSESPYLSQQLALAGSELSGNQQDDVYNSQTDKDLSSSLASLTKMGGTPNDVASVFGASTEGRARYAMLRSNLRLQKISNYQNALNAKEEDRERAFGYNVTAPYKDKTAANAQSLISAQGDISSGIDTAGSALASGLATNNANNQLNDYFKVNHTLENGGKGGTLATVGTKYTGNAMDVNYIDPNQVNQNLIQPTIGNDYNSFDQTRGE